MCVHATATYNESIMHFVHRSCCLCRYTARCVCMYMYSTMEDVGMDVSECHEEGCGQIFVGTDVEEADCLIRESDIEGAGLGLHARSPIAPNIKIGYFGGERICVECVRKRKLTLLKENHCVILCGKTYNNKCEEVLWYLHRTGNAEIDGCMWYINSETTRSIRRGYKVNCRVEGQGFGVDCEPIVCVYAANTVVLGSNEYLLDYMNNKK